MFQISLLIFFFFLGLKHRVVNYIVSRVEVNFYVLFQHIFCSLNLSEDVRVTLVHWELTVQQDLHSLRRAGTNTFLPAACLDSLLHGVCLSCCGFFSTSPLSGLHTHCIHPAVSVCRPSVLDSWEAFTGLCS